MPPQDHASARLIDASANRAREGVRTLEDLARFVLDDQALCARAKSIRHELTQALGGLPLAPGLLLSARDTPGDVGADVSTSQELARADLASVASAAAKRAGEALRSIEELAKTLAADAPAFESLRYRLYDLERSVVLALGRRAPQWRLCVLITAPLCQSHPWERVAQLAIAGGADCLQLREKGLPDAELLARARALVAIARDGGASVIINDRPDIALLSAADGVHLGQGDMSPGDARRVLGLGALVGVSTASMDQARRAVADGASYCGLGPVFPSGTKPKPALAGAEYARAYLSDPATRATPHLAISGIDEDNAGALAELGVRGVAVSAAVCASPEPDRACRAILSALGD